MSDDDITPGVRPYGRYLGLLVVLIVVLVSINAALTRSKGSVGVEPGHRLPPFAVPLARGDLNGAADVATRANDGAAGRVPACAERGTGILNICELYEQGPVVLALFVDAGSCPQILSDMQALAPSFPNVRFAGVAIKGARGELLQLIEAKRLSIPIGFDSEGTLAGLYKLVSCPQVSFAYPGGVVQSRTLLERPALATLRARVSELVAAARARGWRPRAAR
ncbi:MAG: TlpA family protein disulfide reductase [Solirubrobacteraceae bacterium]